MRHRKHRRSRGSHSRGAFTKPLSLVAPAVTGAAGALAVNAIINYAPVPDQLKAGNMLYLTRAGIAILLGIFGPRLPFVGRYAHAAALGSLIVTTTDFGKLLALQQGVNLSGLGYIGPARVLSGPGRTGNVGRFVPRGNTMSAPGMGAFIPRR
jgi:hypothetical protein